MPGLYDKRQRDDKCDGGRWGLGGSGGEGGGGGEGEEAAGEVFHGLILPFQKCFRLISPICN